MTDNRIATSFWIEGALRQCNALNMPAYVLQRGADFSGTLALKLYVPAKGAKVLIQSRNENGALIWVEAVKPRQDGQEYIAESEADAYIARAISRDPDLWVVEIETRTGEHPFILP
jgi:hypothetical protein